MRFSLQTKFFLATALLLAVMLGLFVALSRVGLQRGIGPYVAEIELSRLDWMADNLQAAYARNGSWDFLRGNATAWHGLQWPDGAGPPPRRPRFERGPDDSGPPPDFRGHHPPDMRPREGRPPMGPIPQVEVLPGRMAPPPPLDAPKDERGRAGSIYDRLAVLDATGKVVVGKADIGDAARLPLRVQGRQVGTLALAPLQGIGSAADRAFVSRQIGFIGSAGLVGLLLALVLSVWTARRWLLRPIEALADGARRVAQGQLDAPVEVAGSDELAGLADAFNRMASQLAAVESTRAEWLAATAHELRTPLAALRAEVEAAQDGIRPFTRETLDRLHAQLLRLGRLVDDLRLVTQESYGAAAVRRPIEPLTLFADAAEANALRFDESGLQLEGVQALRDLQGTVRPLVLGDRQRLEQVAVNLLENSLRYTHRGGRVRLQGEVRGDRLAITLEDSAPAPREADYPRLFDRFFRGDASRSRELGGSGLGLAICRGIVQAHGGTIEASPSPLGGLRIVITLPLAQA